MISYEEFKSTAELVSIYEKITEELIKHDGVRPKGIIEKVKHQGAKTALLQARADIAKEVSPIVDLRI